MDGQRLIDFEETHERDDEMLSEEESKEEPYARDLYAGDSAYNQAYDENTSDDGASLQRNQKSGQYHNSIFSQDPQELMLSKNKPTNMTPDQKAPMMSP